MRKIAAIVPGFVAVAGVWWAATEGPLQNPQDALRDFYEARNRAEDQIMDPLILNGHRVVPLALGELPNKDMRRRRYAIGFLGNGRYSEALPVLEKILADDTEAYYFRADALEAISQISADRARELARAYVQGERMLGEVAQGIVEGRSLPYPRRSYWQAFRGWHE